MIGLDIFKRRILEDLLPEYCNDPTRRWGTTGFQPDWSRVAEPDAADFLKALDGGLLQHVGRGQYVAPRSAAKETFFWEGPKSIKPRPTYLWIEPVITAAGIARLHFEYGWPIDAIGAQSADWAFDIVAFKSSTSDSEHIVCEVKKSEREIEQLVSFMQDVAAHGVADEVGLVGAQKNAFRKRHRFIQFIARDQA
ncbi:MAG: hypothetical protein EOP84_17990 [Verrucomicrobiaceae bacterium]|nr:MAG: hypothetical protein EOP84_17990 [Verrucomicrobiaceae bacterium]